MVCCRCLLGLLGLPDKPFFYQSLSHHLSIIIPLLTIRPGLWNPIGYCDCLYIYIYVCTLCPLLKSYMFTINYPPINHLTTWKTHVGPFWHWLYHSGCKAHNWIAPEGASPVKRAGDWAEDCGRCQAPVCHKWWFSTCSRFTIVRQFGGLPI